MNYDEYYFVECDAVYVNRIVSNLYDSAFVLSGLMTSCYPEILPVLKKGKFQL